MSEKRFEFKLKVNFIDEETGEEIYHKVLIDNSNGNEIGFDDMVGLLNHLHQENQQLKHYKLYEDNKRLQTIIADLKEEKEQLKYDNTMFKQIIKNFQKVAQTDKRRLEDENEQLRQTIKEYEYQIEKGYTDLTYEEILEKESDDV